MSKSKLKNKLNFLNKDKIKSNWEDIDSQQGLSTKDKLAKLVNLNLKRDLRQPKTAAPPKEEKAPPIPIDDSEGYIVREFSYPLSTTYGKFQLSQWQDITAGDLELATNDDEFEDIEPMNMVFFDTETTGLSGGTGTIPFMLGFGYFSGDVFLVKIFILSDLNKESEFLDTVDAFLKENNFSGCVTYNGKTFDFPLMETRYILQRKRFPLLRLPHLDFLFPARALWKYTYASRSLGYLGDVLLGISREEDIDGSRIPMIYFNFLRSRSYSLIEQVVEHNALDLLGLAGLVLLGVNYTKDISHTQDEGEILGVARIHEKYGNLEKAESLYQTLKQSAVRQEVLDKAVKGLSFLMKKRKLYNEAAGLWEILSQQDDRHAVRELAMHLEHREKDYAGALQLVENGLATISLSDAQRLDFEKRLQRLKKKTASLAKEENKRKESV